MANHPQPFVKHLQNQELTAEEKVIYHAYVLKAFSQSEVTFLQYTEGGVSKEIFEARMSGLRNLVKLNPRVAQEWQFGQRFAYTPDFIAYIDENIIGGNGS